MNVSIRIVINLLKEENNFILSKELLKIIFEKFISNYEFSEKFNSC